MSENYATSTWCLDELHLILEQRTKHNHFVLPVFYHVEPTDIRKKKGNFALAVKPSSKWTDDNVEKWESALVEFVDLAGHVVASGKPETSILKEIVYTIYNKLERREVSLPSYIIGMARHEKEININSWIEQCHLEFLIILGMGGSGKTTLAKYIYNLIWKNFEYVSFLEDISTGNATLVNLQEQLFKDISGRKRRKIPSVSQGTPKIELALERHKALIVLDDVSDYSQLVDLLGNKKINSKSKIVVTTRENTDNWFDSSCWRCQKYKMKLLNDDESLELFSHHAFRSKTPVADLEEIVRRALQYCEGNPMALKMLGSSLKVCDSFEDWKSQMRLFERNMDSRLQDVVQTSYKSLTCDTVKELFLHIACFLNGKDMDYAGKTVIHSLFQEMEKHLVRQKSTKFPPKRSRVWLSRDSHMILRKGKEDIYNIAEMSKSSVDDINVAMLKDEDYSSSSLMVSSGANVSGYDVFLNFRGLDTGNTFTDHLYYRLNEEGISTYRYDGRSLGEELVPEIQRAITKSRASIVVLSENYAASPWCLDELLLILELRRERNHFVLPVFYGVNPSDIFNQRGSFSVQLRPSSGWMDDKVNKWKTALKEVAKLVGLEVSGRRETEILGRIVDTIHNKIS